MIIVAGDIPIRPNLYKYLNVSGPKTAFPGQTLFFFGYIEWCLTFALCVHEKIIPIKETQHTFKLVVTLNYYRNSKMSLKNVVSIFPVFAAEVDTHCPGPCTGCCRARDTSWDTSPAGRPAAPVRCLGWARTRSSRSSSCHI